MPETTPPADDLPTAETAAPPAAPMPPVTEVAAEADVEAPAVAADAIADTDAFAVADAVADDDDDDDAVADDDDDAVVAVDADADPDADVDPDPDDVADTDAFAVADAVGNEAGAGGAARVAAGADAGAVPAVQNLSPAACARLLAQHFPALFGANVHLPIKLRVQGDIQARVPGVFNRKSMSIFLHRHTTSTAYLKALVNAPHRCDLDGQPAGEIDAEHRDAAAAELARRREIVEGRRAQEREAQRARQNEQRNAARKEQQAREAAQHSAEHEARRERAALLRAYESSTLTRANFCALKGIPEDTLDARLDQAWHERAQRAPEGPRDMRAQRAPEGPREPRAQRAPEGPRPAQPRRDERSGPRGPRPAGKPTGSDEPPVEL